MLTREREPEREGFNNVYGFKSTECWILLQNESKWKETRNVGFLAKWMSERDRVATFIQMKLKWDSNIALCTLFMSDYIFMRKSIYTKQQTEPSQTKPEQERVEK